MYIHEAVKKAVEANKCISMLEFPGIKIRPTVGPKNCILSLADGSRPSEHGWQPKADDLMRDDWIVVD